MGATSLEALRHPTAGDPERGTPAVLGANNVGVSASP